MPPSVKSSSCVKCSPSPGDGNCCTMDGSRQLCRTTARPLTFRGCWKGCSGVGVKFVGLKSTRSCS